MSIKVWDYLEEYRARRDEILAAVDRVFQSGRLILGPHVRQFEEAFAAYCGARHGIGVDNGTNALTLSLRALGVAPGSEVITVPNTAVPTVAAIVNAGGIPRFVDIDRETYLMDAGQLEAATTERTACVVPVHLFGQCVDMAAVHRIATRRGVRVLEDCAQSHGASQDGRRCGSLAEIAAFSFYPTKTLGAYGDGGIVLTGDDGLDARVRRLRFYGMEGFGTGDPGVREAKLAYSALEHGYNARLDEVQAAILLVKMAHLDADIARRQTIATRYDDALTHTSIVRPRTRPGNTHVYHLYVCRHPERDRILSEMAERGVLLNVSYPRPIHLMPAYEALGYREGSFPEAERAAREIFSLPMYPSLTEAEQETVCRALGAVLGETVAV
ncbi:MAG: DegT/DnrJ/EryC1/StrS family aminotransferase [Acidobacteria bacterium]|nr:DegT/DnrJ/EryC1/StrS family aminotransferase [Acidobacteriota bacterium]